MSITSKRVTECELYSARFRRNLNSLMKSLNSPRCALKRVVVKSSRTQQPIFVAISAQTYTEEAAYLKRFNTI